MYNTRYWFLKKMYPNHLLLFKCTKNKLGYRAFGIDKIVLDGIRNYSTDIKYVIKLLDDYNINYIIIDNLSILFLKSFEINKYSTYLYKFISLNILDRIRASMFR